MKRYIEQLVEDIQESARQALVKLNLAESSLPVSHSFKKSKKLGNIVGVEKIMFPPLYRLTENQAGLLAYEMEALLNAYQFIPLFPEKLPGYIRYKCLIDIWDTYHNPLVNGQIEIEFCDYTPENCPFPEYCNACKEIAGIENKKFSSEDYFFGDQFPF